MEKYLVGGAVRDQLLGYPVKEHDWVVVGETPETMIKQGFRAVGKDFPVFLHPQSHEEYALARTERKTAPGYKGFSVHADVDVTLEQDLQRRDLTINAIAMTPEAKSSTLTVVVTTWKTAYSGMSHLPLRKIPSASSAWPDLRHVTSI